MQCLAERRLSRDSTRITQLFSFFFRQSSKLRILTIDSFGNASSNIWNFCLLLRCPDVRSVTSNSIGECVSRKSSPVLLKYPSPTVLMHLCIHLMWNLEDCENVTWSKRSVSIALMSLFTDLFRNEWLYCEYSLAVILLNQINTLWIHEWKIPLN